MTDKTFVIKRETYLQRIRPFYETDLIKVLTGMRRSGKSVLLTLIQEDLLSRGIKREQFTQLNLEDFRFSAIRDAKDLNDYLEEKIRAINGRAYLFLDEVQSVKGWEKAVNSLRVTTNADIYLTGSNSDLLSGELATIIAGRYIEFVVYPFSYEEFITAYQQHFPEADLAEIFDGYLKFGGMPYLSKLGYNEENAYQYLRDVYNSVVLKDIVKRYAIRDVDLLERLIHYVSSNIGQPFSATSLSKYFKNEKRKVAVETIINYLKACTEAFLFYPVGQLELRGKQLLTINDKYYIVDHSLRKALFTSRGTEIQLVLENIVQMEALRRGYTVYTGRLDKQEVDFICQKPNETVYIQVAYLLASPETINREFGVYEAVKDNFPKYVVSLDAYDMSQNGIKHQHVRDFLLLDAWT